MKILVFDIFVILFLQSLVSCENCKFVVDSGTINSNVLYAGLENPIIIKGCGKRAVHLKTSIGAIRNLDSNSYLIYPDTLPGTLTLSISNCRKEKNIQFRIKEIPNISIIALTDTLISESNVFTSANFRTFTFLRPEIRDFDLNCKIEICSFNLTRISNEGTKETVQITAPRRVPNESNYLTKKAIAGNVYLFENILLKIKPLNDTLPSYSRKMKDVIYLIK